jgi:hypothetical protein
MGRPNLSERNSFCSWLLVLNFRLGHGKKRAGRTHPAGASFPMCSSRSTGGAVVSIRTFGKRVARAPSPAYAFPRRRSQGMPKGLGSRKLNSIINLGALTVRHEKPFLVRVNPRKSVAK